MPFSEPRSGLITRGSPAGRRPRRCDGLRRAMMPENGTAHWGYRRASSPPMGGASGSPKQPHQARLFPRFRRLKRSSAATHMPTVGRPGERRAHEDCGRNGGWPWVIFSRSFFYLLAKPRGVSRMIRRLFVCVLCCVPSVPGSVGQKVGIPRPLTDRYGRCRLAAGESWCVGGVWETRGQHRRPSPKNQCGHFRHCYPALR